jgi:hypothetical protein
VALSAEGIDVSGSATETPFVDHRSRSWFDVLLSGEKVCLGRKKSIVVYLSYIYTSISS